jgi:acetylornithine deacetylase/succinyl-diaminopimelate desuccinylase-like protein
MRLPRALCLWLCLLTGCASAPPPEAQTPPPAPSVPNTPPPAPSAAIAPPQVGAEPCPRALALDPAQLAQEASCLLAEYVRIDTTNPPGNELAAAQFLQRVLAREGITTLLVESAAGRANLIARVEGQSDKALALLHHMDVVPATASEWSVPPFSAIERDGYLWGRGSLDNKGGGIVHLMTMLMAKRLGTALPRDLVLLAVADEEAGGAQGARFMLEHHAALYQGIEFVLNEGGAIVEPSAGQLVYSVELAQKAPLWVRLTARGRSGHGAQPNPQSSVAKLVRALARLQAHAFPIVVRPEVQVLFAAKAATLPEPLREGARDLTKALKRPAFRDAFLKDASNHALVSNTLSITMLSGSDKENVVPPEASAVLDMRLLPGQEPNTVLEELKRIMAEPEIELTTLLSWQAHASPKDTALFRAIEAHAAAEKAPVIPNVVGGFTDCNAFRARGITCYGFTPIRLQPEAFGRIHGKDERIHIAALGQAIVELHALALSLQ